MGKRKSERGKGLTAFVLGGTPSIMQKVFSVLMTFSLVLWPLGIYVSAFFFDAPIRSGIDKLGRYGMLLTIWLYPLYLFPLMRILFNVSKRVNAILFYYLTPVIPIIVIYFFLLCTSFSSSSNDHKVFSNEDLIGNWTLVGNEKQINYPYIEFYKDSTAKLYSQADTLYSYTYFVRNDSLHLVDINGRQCVNKICKLDSVEVIFEGIADVESKQTYRK